MEKIQFIEKVSAFIEKHHLLHKESKVLVTLSGGADSVALLFALRQMGVNCIVAHCNFHLRGEESMRDENFVRSLCERLELQCAIENFDVHAYMQQFGVSVEMACRELRYTWFEKLRSAEKCDVISVAHHRDDRIETFFLNALRGTGVAGLASIKPKNEFVVRPLLNVTRQEIERYLEQINEGYIIDGTNAENDFKRNRLRNLILPALKEHFPDAETGISRTIENLYTSNEVYQSAINDYKNKIVSLPPELVARIDIAKLDNVDGRSAILHELLKGYGFNFSQVEDIINSHVNHNSGACFIAAKYEAILNRGTIDIIMRDNVAIFQKYDICFKDDEVSIADIDISVIECSASQDIDFKTPPTIAYFDGDICNKRVELRTWQKGDRFTPFGMRGYKKVSDLLIDNKVSLNDKNNVLVLTVDQEIVWVVGLRRSGLYLPSKSQEMIVCMRMR